MPTGGRTSSRTQGLSYPLNSALRYRDFAWWDVALTAPDQLRQRMAWALSQILVTNERVGVFSNRKLDSAGRPRFMGVCDYYDIFVENGLPTSDAGSGNYRKVVQEVTYHPVMGNFLTHINSRPPFPDENYTRELLQLILMGEYRMRQNGVFVKNKTTGELIRNYTNEDILDFARVLTGLRYHGNEYANLHDPMEIMNPRSHHDWGEKFMPTLRITVPEVADDAQKTADAANKEITDVIDQLYQHRNVPPFVARQLIQRFVMSNPSKGYIRRVANVFANDGTGQRGNLRAVITAVLTDKVALRTQRYARVRASVNGKRRLVGLRVSTRGTEHSRLQEPVIRLTQFFRLYATAASPGYRIYPNSLDTNQLPFKAPSVFNFYRPDYVAPGFENYAPSLGIPNGELHGPEFQIMTPVFANRFSNRLRTHIHNNNPSGSVDLTGAFAKEAELAGAEDLLPLMERLNILLCHGSMSDTSEEIIAKAIVASGSTNNLERARSAVLAVLTSPECAIRD